MSKRIDHTQPPPTASKREIAEYWWGRMEREAARMGRPLPSGR